jgi:hypothetical protein
MTNLHAYTTYLELGQLNRFVSLDNVEHLSANEQRRHGGSDGKERHNLQYVCVYIYIYIYIYIAFVVVCVCMCVLVFIHTYIDTHTHIHTQTHSEMKIQANLGVQAQT